MSDTPRYRRVYANEWHDAAFRRLNDAARIVRFYVTAGPQTTSVGCFRLSTAVAVEDLGGTAEDFEERLQTVCDAFGWAWDPLARVIWITNWFDLNQPANPNVVHAWAKLLRNVPDCDAKTQAIASINQHLKDLPASFREPWRELFKTFPISESKAQSRTESIQGAGSREFRSGSREQAARAVAAVKDRKPKTNNFPEVDSRVVRIAEDVIRDAPRQVDADYLIDALQAECRRRGMEIVRTQAVAALSASQRGLSA